MLLGKGRERREGKDEWREGRQRKGGGREGGRGGEGRGREDEGREEKVMKNGERGIRGKREV